MQDVVKFIWSLGFTWWAIEYGGDLPLFENLSIGAASDHTMMLLFLELESCLNCAGRGEIVSGLLIIWFKPTAQLDLDVLSEKWNCQFVAISRRDHEISCLQYPFLWFPILNCLDGRLSWIVLASDLRYCTLVGQCLYEIVRHLGPILLTRGVKPLRLLQERLISHHPEL